MDESKTNCPCWNTKCERHGDCTACRESHHATEKSSLTHCEKLADKEKKRQMRRMKRGKF